MAELLHALILDSAWRTPAAPALAGEQAPRFAEVAS